MIAQADVMSMVYLNLQKELHGRPEGYGDKGDKWAPAVAEMVTRFGARSVLDYGCGKGALMQALKPLVSREVLLSEYDPAIYGKDSLPSRSDVVTCCDVLEHVEPERIDAVIEHINVLARKAVLLVVSTRTASRSLADGRNAHLIVEPPQWWIDKITSHGFSVHQGPCSPLLKPSREWVAVLTQ